MGLISRKENRARQRWEAAQHTTPMQGLPTGKKGTLWKGKDTDVFEGQTKTHRRRGWRWCLEGMLTGDASGVSWGEKMPAKTAKNGQVLSRNHWGGKKQLHHFSSTWYRNSWNNMIHDPARGQWPLEEHSCSSSCICAPFPFFDKYPYSLSYNTCDHDLIQWLPETPVCSSPTPWLPFHPTNISGGSIPHLGSVPEMPCSCPVTTVTPPPAMLVLAAGLVLLTHALVSLHIQQYSKRIKEECRYWLKNMYFSFSFRFRGIYLLYMLCSYTHAHTICTHTIYKYISVGGERFKTKNLF